MIPAGAGVVERAQVGQVEAPVGLAGRRVAVAAAGEGPLAGTRVGTGAAQQPGPGDVDADQHQGHVEIHQLADQVKGVLVIAAVQPEPGYVVDEQRGRGGSRTALRDRPDQVVQGGGVRVAVDVQDGLAQGLGGRPDREPAVGHRHEQVPGPGDGAGRELAADAAPQVLELGRGPAGGLGLALEPPPLIISPSRVPGANFTALSCSRPRIRSETFLLIGVSCSRRFMWVAVRCRSCSARPRGLRAWYSASDSLGAGMKHRRVVRHCCQPSHRVRSGGGPARKNGTTGFSPAAGWSVTLAGPPRRLRAARTRCGPGSLLPGREAASG